MRRANINTQTAQLIEGQSILVTSVVEFILSAVFYCVSELL